MELPETMRPSPTSGLARWIGVLAALTAGALWINRRTHQR
jgi:hypothetical protein